MKINFRATKAKMMYDGINLSRWARARGFAPPTFLLILSGKYPSTTGEVYKKTVAALDSAGFLVRKQDDSEQAA